MANEIADGGSVSLPSVIPLDEAAYCPGQCNGAGNRPVGTEIKRLLIINYQEPGGSLAWTRTRIYSLGNYRSIP